MSTDLAPAPSRTTPARDAAAWALVLLGPPLAWLACISWSSDKASDAQHVAWFATVAATTLVAGSLARPNVATLLAMSVAAFASTMTTLYLWWSSDITGLFMVGILIATLPVAAAAPALLALGRLAPWSR